MIARIKVYDTAIKKSSFRDIIQHAGHKGTFTYSWPPN